MNKVVVGVVAGAMVVAGAAGFGTLVYPQMRAKAEVDKAIAELSADTQIRYHTVQYSLFTGTLALGGVEVTVHDGGETLNAKLSSLTLRDMGKERVGRLHGSGFSLEDAEGTMRIDAESVTGSEITATDGVLKGVATATMNMERLALSDVTVTTAEDKTHLREIVLADYIQAGKVPQSMSLGVHGVLVDAKSLPDQDARDGLAKLGYDRLSLNFDLSYVHAPESQRLSIKQAAISGDDIGQLSLSASFGRVPALTSDTPEDLLAAAQGATLERLDLRYQDSSLTGRVLKLAASEAEMDEATLKASLMMQLAAQSGTETSPLVKQALLSAGAFLAEPKSLSVQMNPAEPIPLMLFMLGADPESLVQSAGLKVLANQ